MQVRNVFPAQSDRMYFVNLYELNVSFYFLFTFFLECVPSRAADVRQDERDWSLAIDVSERRM